MSTPNQRHQLKKSLPNVEVSLTHTQNGRLLPNRSELLYRLPKAGVAAEIGAAFGDFTTEILNKNKPKQLHLVDAWESERYKKGLEDIRAKFSKELEDNRLKIHQGWSTEMLETFGDGFFDWVYIDTDHTYDTTWRELQICDRKVKQDGRIAGHDFCTGNVVSPFPYGVIEAVTKFCRDFGWQYEYITVEPHGHLSFCLMRV
ncbi:class I SAM-dependent methyltransferase [Sinorhizobium meliloti]|uniref:class I SAM-dependent methyltransferase n=1 Tax=Rhizobium meliloti TaxID=382 RepID=UPI000FD199AD|nr:class I SAM-dependent methyltransferase [Sinorhizobium meliloti]MDW9633602.1 class I SAM-dependent methyltransferase [Sinorhizobium meliloti]RVJ90026.1 class I SAM-dependent methyltransferase [Sinorhizobium meliloti]